MSQWYQWSRLDKVGRGNKHIAIKKILKYTMTVVICIATCGTVWVSSTDAPPTVAAKTVDGAAGGMYNESSMAGKVKAIDTISVIILSDIMFNIGCDKDDGAIGKIQSGIGETRNNSNQSMDLLMIAMQDDSNGDGSTFLQTVNLYLAEGNKMLDEIKILSEAKLESGAQNEKITTLQRSSSQQIRLYGEAASDTNHLQKERCTIQVMVKISKAPANQEQDYHGWLITGMIEGGRQMAARVPCTDFGKKVEVAMVEQDVPQHQLAKELGVATPTISDIIYGRNRSEKIKARIAKVLGIEL